MMPGQPQDPSQPVTAVCPNCHRTVQLLVFERVNALVWPVHLVVEPTCWADFSINVCSNGYEAMSMAVSVAAQLGGTDGSQG